MLKKIFGILGWIGMALVLAALGLRFFRSSQFELSRYLAWAGLVCVLLYLAGQWREMAALFSGRNAKYGTLSLTSVVVVLGILVGLNYIGQRQNKRWDLTANKAFSLSDQTRKVLQDLKSPLEISVFAQDREFPRFRDRLNEYEYLSKQVKVEYVDVDRNPARARQMEIQQYGTIVVQHEGRTERTTLDTEQDITNAVIKAVQGAQKKVYFTQGHGEKDPVSSDQRSGYSGVSDALKRDNFGVEKLVLAQQSAVPDDASVVVIAGPQADFLDPEMQALRAYANKGGKVLLMLDPPNGPDDRPLANLIGFAKEWGMDVGSNIVVDVSGMGQLIGTGPSVPIAANYPSHPITDRFNLMTAFPLARSVTPVSGGTGENARTAQNVVETGPRSWAETDLGAIVSGKEVALDEGKGDKPGPVAIAAAISVTAPEQPAATPPASGESTPPPESPKRETRVATFGDSDFASNAALGVQGNRDLFVNTINWLAQQENLIAIRPKDPEDRRVTMTADQQFIVFLLAIPILPGVIFAAGIASWWRRRGR